MSANLISSLLSCPELAEGPAVLLFGGPYVVLDGRRLEVPEGSKRLLAFITLNARPVDRQHVAGCLWPTGSDQRAAGNLRSALWRLKCAGINVIESDKCSLTLRNGTVVDIRVVSEWAARLIDGSAAQSDLCPVFWPADAMDLLPGWYDDWVLVEAEDWRQLRLHALETLADRLTAVGCWGQAADAAGAAVRAEPLRESAHAALIQVHLAEGNQSEAVRQFTRYRALLHAELGLEPTPRLCRLLQGLHRQGR